MDNNKIIIQLFIIEKISHFNILLEISLET